MNNSVNTYLKNIFAYLPLFQIKEIFCKDYQQFKEMSHRN